MTHVPKQSKIPSISTLTDHLWLPYTQMKTSPSPIMAKKTQGSHIYLEDGTRLIDGIASWWTACHGYNHPVILEAAQHQLTAMPHIMLGGIVHQPALQLSTELSALLGHDLNHVFFSDSGSVSVEVAMKMAFQYWLNKKQSRHHILSFKGGYHGDTLYTMSICDPEEGMHTLFKGIVPQQPILDLPVTAEQRKNFDVFLEQNHTSIAAIVVEPLVQGAGGMIFYSAETLHYLYKTAQKYALLLICDEVFTGFGRTGSMFAFQQAEIIPDIITLSKALTGGTMGLAATIARTPIYEAFLSDQPEHALMHGPTFMGNPLACACALASLSLFATQPRLEEVRNIGQQMQEHLSACTKLACVKNVRVMGAIGVVELYTIPDMAALKKELLSHFVWIRPFRNIVYITPAFTISSEDVAILCSSIYQTLQKLYS
ncbi:adenosylmethionine--8-amino-7-oxononanoate transaminase [Entomobacter blattae]|uniref:Adenosylmethionine-8-amino-7-oxononanoate aminotransferase n=1 Tax=Entomobacter blattae TaxID=2762277 RepID=A0A7H1NSE0_9PROT|nr:adenosylmethionine--8-amino-7-oxononanoate transaminase [Entomobacter blattae]QNT78700.1 Adenosylmethionine-8-amino-7-oxononanoate aminotransferase [Entomobacter blattae]